MECCNGALEWRVGRECWTGVLLSMILWSLHVLALSGVARQWCSKGYICSTSSSNTGVRETVFHLSTYMGCTKVLAFFPSECPGVVKHVHRYFNYDIRFKLLTCLTILYIPKLHHWKFFCNR
jgi:hypothetical protein